LAFISHLLLLGADMINDNLRYLSNLTGPNAIIDPFEVDRRIESTHGAKNLKDLHTYLLKISKPSDYTSLIKQARFFTFVIDPIERFLFSINECYLRGAIPRSLDWKALPLPQTAPSGNFNNFHESYNNNVNDEIKKKKNNRKRRQQRQQRQHQQQYQRHVEKHQATPDIARDILRGILTGDMALLESYLLFIPTVNHFFPMSNMLREFQPDFVGDYGDILHEWAGVEKLYGSELPLRHPPGHSKYQHMGRVDALGLIRTMRTLLAEEPLYMEALCKLYIRDYVCFNISLPRACWSRTAQHATSSSSKVVAYAVGRSSFFPPLRQF
jgi:hypothetical protein